MCIRDSPSTSKYNLNGVVAYLADVHYENEEVTSMDVSFFYTHENINALSVRKVFLAVLVIRFTVQL